jgi:hypothetical protein
MCRRVSIPRLCGLVVLAALSTIAARADSLVVVTSQTGQGANDSVQWSQLGSDGTILGSSVVATSTGGSAVTLALAGPNSVVAVACTASPCSWTGAGFTAGDSLIWTSDSGNGGNGPLTLNLASGVSGAGASIQADGPGQFTAQIQAFNGAASLGLFTVTSDANGDAVYIGVLDQSGSNITSVVFSLASCTGICADFAIDAANLNTAPQTLVSLVSSLSPSALGQSVTFTATVKPAVGSGAPSGTVTFEDSAAVLGVGTLSGGMAAVTTSGLGGGVHSITAVYGGDTNFTGSTSPVLTQTVSKGTSSIALTSSNNPSGRGAAVIFTATVTTSAAPKATGSVTFKDGASVLGMSALSGGIATFTTSGLGTGAHSITAVYAGDANYTGSTSLILLETVTKAASATSVASSNNPSNVGTALTLTASVTSTAGTPTGTVAFQDGVSAVGTVTLNNGTAAITTSGLASGAHSITAVYGGDANFAGSTSQVLTQTVNKMVSSTSIASSINPSISGSGVTFTAIVTSAAGAPTGALTFQDGTSALGTATLSGGRATITTSALGGGVHSISAVYGGDANFAGSTSPALAQTVADFSLSASPNKTTITAGSTSTYTITITPEGGFSQPISFHCSGAPISVTCTTPASVSPTGGLYAPFSVTVAMSASSQVLPVAPFHHPASGPRETLEWLLAVIACGILTVAASMRSRGLQLSTVVTLVLLVCAGCASSGIGNNSSPNPANAPGTYTLTLAGTSGSLSHNATVTLTVK